MMLFELGSPRLLEGLGGASSGQSTEKELAVEAPASLGVLPSCHVLAKFCKRDPTKCFPWQWGSGG